MKKFLIIYNAPAEAMAKMATATEEEKKGRYGCLDGLEIKGGRRRS